MGGKGRWPMEGGGGLAGTGRGRLRPVQTSGLALFSVTSSRVLTFRINVFRMNVGVQGLSQTCFCAFSMCTSKYFRACSAHSRFSIASTSEPAQKVCDVSPHCSGPSLTTAQW